MSQRKKEGKSRGTENLKEMEMICLIKNSKKLLRVLPKLESGTEKLREEFPQRISIIKS